MRSGQVRRGIHIGQRVDLGNGRGQGQKRGGHRVSPRPSDRTEYPGRGRHRGVKTDKPEPAVPGRTNHGTCRSKCVEGPVNMHPCDPWDVGADQHPWPGAHRQAAPHSRTEIARTLRNAWDVGRPEPALQAFPVGRHSQHQRPSGIAKLTKQRKRLPPVPMGGVDHPDFGTQSGFYPAWPGLLDHDDQGFPVQRRCTIFRCGMSASRNSGPSGANPRAS